MRRPRIERWLVFLTSLGVVAFVGFCVWFVLDSTSQNFVAKLFNHELTETAASTAASEAAGIHLVLAVNFVTLALILIAIFAVWHRLRFLGFCECVKEIEAVGGIVRFSNSKQVTLACYLFGETTVDLSDTDVNDSRLPDLRCIPRLISLRLAGTNVTARSIPKFAGCQHLGSLDVTETNVRAVDLEQLVNLPSLNSILCD